MKRILLHVCCAPCSTHCVHALREAGLEPVVYYSNSNIDTEEEWERRLAALRAFAGAEGVEVRVDPRDAAAWEREVAAGFEDEPEGGARCDRCFRFNLARAAAEAARLGVDAFTTSLTVSPHKSSPRVFAAGRAAAEAVRTASGTAPRGADEPAPPPAPAFAEFDFKKKGGFQDSVALARKYGLYRQAYCGCRFSKRRLRERMAATIIGGTNGE